MYILSDMLLISQLPEVSLFHVIQLEAEMFRLGFPGDFIAVASIWVNVLPLQTLYKTQVKELREEVDEKAKQVQDMSNEIRQLSEER